MKIHVKPPTLPDVSAILSWPSTQAMIQDLEDNGNPLTEIVIARFEIARQSVEHFKRNYTPSVEKYQARVAIMAEVIRDFWLSLCYQKGRQHDKQDQ